MSLPFVSRQHHEEVTAFWRKSSDTAWEHYAQVLEKYHQLRMQGAARAEPVEKLQPAERDVVTQAILAKAGKSSALRKHYYEFVTVQRREGFSDDAIAKAIMKGEDDDGGIPG